jgi:isoprenylcysteine carboxyl methyltransferase (ICMT) family protein YpbQ
MRPTLAELEEAERAYRKLRFTMICHAAFFVVCCVTAVVVRRAMGLPPALLGVVIIVALVVFGGDIMKFLASRERVRRLRTALNSPS